MVSNPPSPWPSTTLTSYNPALSPQQRTTAGASSSAGQPINAFDLLKSQQQSAPQPSEPGPQQLLAAIAAVMANILQLMRSMMQPAQASSGGGSSSVNALASTGGGALGTGWMQNQATSGILPTGYQQALSNQQTYQPGAMSSNATFDQALKLVLKWEGGYVNHPNDPGGATNKGVTQATYDSWRRKKGLAPQSVRSIVQAEVNQIYKEDYWQASGADKIAQTNPALAMAVFNCAVNMGVGRASELLKKSGSDVGQFLNLQEQKYRSFAANGQGMFLEGWLNRHREVRQTAQAMASRGGGPTA